MRSISPPWPLTRLMVSPCTPARYSASRTALTLSDRTIATTNFIERSSFGHDQNGPFAAAVRLFAVLADVQADALLLHAGRQTNDQRHKAQNGERHHGAEGDGGRHGDELNPELSRIAEERPVRDTVPFLLGEVTCQQSAADGT